MSHRSGRGRPRPERRPGGPGTAERAANSTNRDDEIHRLIERGRRLGPVVDALSDRGVQHLAGTHGLGADLATS